MTSIRPLLVVSSHLRSAKAIVLLAGGYEERVPLAVDLYHKKNAEKLIVTDDNVRRGWSTKHQRNLYSRERIRDALIELGVPRQSIVILPFRKCGTIFDAIAVRDYLAKEHLGQIMLVTSDYHTRRALWIFRLAMRDMPISIGVAPASTSFFSVAFLKEPFKLLYYWLRFGWVGAFPASAAPD